MASQSEIAISYAALILADDGVAITSDKLNSILKAANVTVEPFWPKVYAKLFETNDINKLLTAGAAPAPVAAAPAAAPAAAKKEEKKEEKKADAPKKEEKKKEEAPPEEDTDMGFGLFD